MEQQIIELIEFLHEPKLEVRAIALHHIAGFTHASSEYQSLVLSKRKTVIPDLKALCREDPITAHDALKALINLSGDPRVHPDLDDDKFIKHICLLITIPKSVLADVACMLLSNMTKYEPICVKLVDATVAALPDLSESTRLMDHLVEVFHRGVTKAYNPQAEFHFLASVFANASTIRHGRIYFIEEAKHDHLAPITKIQIFSEDRNIIRRGGTVSTIKNCCFETRKHDQLLDSDGINILPFILLPLCGNEEYDMDEFEKFPEEIQLLGDDKTREADPLLRLMLTEAILLLTTTRNGRDYLREKQVYRVVQRLHAQEKDDKVFDKCQDIVDMLMRDEGEEKIVEIGNDTAPEIEEEEEDEDLVIEEIV
ncbi:Protein hgh1 [Umbelopsis sp. WA50703]